MGGENPARTGTLPVLVTTSIIVHAEKERIDKDGFTFVEPFGERLRQAIKEAFRQDPEVDYPGTLEFNPIWIEDTNVGRCERCGAWMSDYTQPDYLVGIVAGRQIDGHWLCDECETFPDELR